MSSPDGPNGIEADIQESVDAFRRRNAELGTRAAMPISVLVRGLVRKTGLKEEKIVALLSEMGIRMEPSGPAPSRKPLKLVSDERLGIFLEQLDRRPDRSEDPLPWLG